MQEVVYELGLTQTRLNKAPSSKETTVLLAFLRKLCEY